MSKKSQFSKNILRAIICIVSFFAFFRVSFVYAGSLGVSASVPIEGDGGNSGDIVSYSDGNYVLCAEPYSDKLYGVITNSSVISIKDQDLTDANSRLVLPYGEALINVTTANGNIKKGDYITSSSTPGIGQKATKSGFVIGRALEDYESTDTTQVKDILAFIDIKSAYIEGNLRVNLIEALRTGAAAPFITPITSMRYILAALIIAVAFAIGFSSFGRTSGSSIEALGRNPLAKNTIKSAVIFNFILTFMIMVMGIVFSYLILVL